MIKTKLLVPAVALFALAGCQTNGDMYRSDVYGSNQVNQAQQVQTVEIIAIQPARVAVNNQSDRNVSQMVGTALGGILGAVIGNQVTHHRDSGTAIGAIAGAALGAAGSSAASPQNSLVDGVQLTFKMNGRIFNSAGRSDVRIQVRPCHHDIHRPHKHSYSAEQPVRLQAITFVPVFW